jgi:ribosomal protein S12 methylthiotransferase
MAKNHSPNPKTVALISLGCPKNTVDSEVILGKLAQDHYVIVQDPAQAEIIIVNTCGFIEAAKKESIETILDAAKLRKTGKLKTLVVGGCLAQRYGEELKKELPEIDVLFGLNDIEQVADRIINQQPRSLSKASYVYDASAPRLLLTPSHYAYVKIAEGCDLPCSFCTIPEIRGPYRSRALEDIVQEARQLASEGVKEICLIAQDSTWYGADRYGKPRLTELLERLAKVEELEWVRLHYLYPTRVTDELLQVMAGTEKICAYFDMPLQHANNRILKAMQRIGDKSQMEGLIKRIKTKIPKASIRSTFIIGFPGETDQEFNELLDFLKGAEMDYVGFFPYSQEEGTPAADMENQVPEAMKNERLAEALRVQEEIEERSHQKWVGEKLRAVVESVDEDGAQGRTQYQAPEVDGIVLVEGLKGAVPGQRVNVEITHTLGQDLVGKTI